MKPAYLTGFSALLITLNQLKNKNIGEKTQHIGEKIYYIGEKTQHIGEKIYYIGEKTQYIGETDHN